MHFLLNTFIYMVFLGASHLAWEGNIPTVQTVANWPWVKWILPSPSGSWKGPKYSAQDHSSEGEKRVRWETRSRKGKSIWREKDTGVSRTVGLIPSLGVSGLKLHRSSNSFPRSKSGPTTPKSLYFQYCPHPGGCPEFDSWIRINSSVTFLGLGGYFFLVYCVSEKVESIIHQSKITSQLSSWQGRSSILASWSRWL